MARRIRDNLRTCSLCGKKILDYGYRNGETYNSMSKSELCYECAFWLNLIDNPVDGQEVILGKCYRVHEGGRKRFFKTYGSKRVLYILKKDGTAMKTNDVWPLGDVPERFKDKLPDTAYWIGKKEFNRLKNGVRRCKAKGCMDRYHCLLFDYRTEFDRRPFNFVPNTWKVGDECCRDFVNILNIKGYHELYDINDIINAKIQEDEEVHH